MIIHVLRALKDNFIYVLEDREFCAVVDPGDAVPVLSFVQQRNLDITHILCTHHHRDHTGGLDALMSDFPNADVWCSEFDRPRIFTRARAVSGNLQIGNMPIQIIALPGHTLGQIGFYLPEHRALFSGDTLFSAGCGRLFEGTHEQMFATMQTIRSLPEDTQIFFGHEYSLRNLQFVSQHRAADMSAVAERIQVCQSLLANGKDTTPTNIQIELLVNPFLRANTVSEFKKWRELRDHF